MLSDGLCRANTKRCKYSFRMAIQTVFVCWTGISRQHEAVLLSIGYTGLSAVLRALVHYSLHTGCVRTHLTFADCLVINGVHRFSVVANSHHAMRMGR